MRLLVTRPMTRRATRAILDRFDATFRDNTPLSERAAAEAMDRFDAIMPTLGDAFTAGAFAKTPRCRILANFGAGFNHIDTAAARGAGVAVTNTPDVVTEATADLAMALILMTVRRASEGERVLRAGEWTGWNPTQLLGGDVSGRPVGIVGMGRIGRAIARRCHFGFGMDVLFFNRSAVADPGVPARRVEGLHDLLSAVEVAVLAVPGGPGTRHMIGRAELAALGPRGHLVNVARGDVVDEAALVEALERGLVAGAGLDVYAREPLVPRGLLDAPNATLLPHLGTATDDTRTAMALRALDNLSAFAAGLEPRDMVN